MTEWKCSADPYAVVPSDCNWPHCGCDPNVERVMCGLRECGYKIIEPDDILHLPEEIAGLIERLVSDKASPEERTTAAAMIAAALQRLAQEIAGLQYERQTERTLADMLRTRIAVLESRLNDFTDPKTPGMVSIGLLNAERETCERLRSESDKLRTRIAELETKGSSTNDTAKRLFARQKP